MRIAKVERMTKETQIRLRLNIDGKGNYTVKTPIGFLTHMIESFAKHGLFDITALIRGDLEVDQHHTVEDCGIAVGQAFKEALGSKKGINRAGYFVFPMDDALAVAAVDIGGRPYLQYDVSFRRRFCGDLDTDVLEQFFYGFSIGLCCNIAVRMPYGNDDHHKIEAVFKAFGKAMKVACSINTRAVGEMPSVKGMIDI